MEYVDYWARLGYEIGGIYMYTFAKFMIDTCIKEQIDHIGFTARDGYGLKKIFNIINTHENITTSYIYAPRLFSYVYNIQTELD